MNNTRTDYSVSQKVVHLLMALLVLVDLTVAQQFGGEMVLSERLDARVGHASIGTIILILLIWRLILRIRNGAPALPNTMPSWQKTAASLTHKGFYVLLAVVIFTGVITGGNATEPIMVFGQWNIGFVENPSEAGFASVRQWHELSTKLLIALIALHVAAAIYHLIVAKDGRTTAMLKFWSSKK